MRCPKVNRTLLPLKIVLFCWYGASSSLIPYMTIHMRGLGITVSETAIIYTLLPVTQLLCTPLAGMIADKLGRYKDVLMLSVLSSVAFATAILFVPPVQDPSVEHPDIHMHCGAVVLPHVAVEKCWDGPCDIFHENKSNPLSIAGCSISCQNDKGLSYTDINHLCQDYPDKNITQRSKQCYLANNPSILLSDSNFSLAMKFSAPYAEKSMCQYRVLDVQLLDDVVIQESNPIPTFKSSIVPSCPVIVHQGGLNCSLKCSFHQLPDDENGTYPHINRCIRTTGNWLLTFWLYFVLRILFNVFNSICLTLLDATAIAMVDAHGGQYGRQRFWAILAQAVFSPVTGFLADLLSTQRGYMDYSPAFHCYNVLAVCTAIAVWIMSVDVPPPAEDVFQNFRKLFKVPPIVVLMLVVFWLGAMWGFVESFLFWYLQDLGSPNFLLGLTLTTGGIVGLPFLHGSDWFVKKIGQVNLLLLALLFYFIRFFGYSYITDPWWCIPFEAMEAFTYHLMWVAAATYSADLVPSGLLATIQGCVGGLHYGVGRGTGSFAGGTLMDHYGARLAFRVMGVSSGFMLLLYGGLYYFWLRNAFEKKRKSPEIELQTQKKKEAENAQTQNENHSTDSETPPKPTSIEVSAEVHCVDRTSSENKIENGTASTNL